MLGRTYTLEEIASAIGAKISGNPVEISINRVVTDSRYRSIDKHSIFFALSSGHNDGHAYVEDAYHQNVRVFVVEKPIPTLPKDAILLQVPNSLEALQNLAIYHRKLIDYPIISLTGSNGKTVVKEWLFQVLSSSMVVSRSPKSYNSQIGVPLSVLSLPLGSDLGIIESGISRPDEMTKLERIIQPEYGIITNIHQAHSENFTSKQHLIEEKAKLFKNSKRIIYRKDYPLLDEFMLNSGKFKGAEIISWSSKGLKANYQVEVMHEPEGCIIRITGEKDLVFSLAYRDDASIENAIHCAITGLSMDLKSEVLEDALARLTPVALRLEQISGINNCTIINDSYNSDLTSLEIALHYLNMQSQHEKKTLIISDIFQSGISPTELYSKVNNMCLNNGVQRVIGIGNEIQATSSVFNIPIETFANTEVFLEEISKHSFYNEGILIKGSRSFEFERISQMLENRKHETHLDVNLSAMIDNFNYFRSKVKPEVKIMVMVKAFSYGTGSYEIANVLQHHAADYLAVAYIDEGIQLREKGIHLPIMVMNPAIGGLQSIVDFNLEPEIYNLSTLSLLSDFCFKSGKKIKIHLKVESGMHRLGLDIDNLDGIVELLSSNPNITVASVFSHLVASDNLVYDDVSLSQINVLDDFCEGLENNGIKDFIKHMLNSDGILRFPEHQYQMVRLGIGLYGISGIEENRSSLRSVISLKTSISQIKVLKAGEGLGYSLNFKATKTMRTATIPIGYADGLSRDLGNGNWYCEVRGKRAPIIGNVCMDMCMLDVSDIPDLHEKEEVIVISGNSDIYKMAQLKQTIPYEILTSISERVKRKFYYGD